MSWDWRPLPIHLELRTIHWSHLQYLSINVEYKKFTTWWRVFQVFDIKNGPRSSSYTLFAIMTSNQLVFPAPIFVLIIKKQLYMPCIQCLHGSYIKSTRKSNQSILLTLNNFIGIYKYIFCFSPSHVLRSQTGHRTSWRSKNIQPNNTSRLIQVINS